MDYFAYNDKIKSFINCIDFCLQPPELLGGNQRIHDP
jgi:hypothetical protein